MLDEIKLQSACHTLPRVEGSVMYKFVSPTQKPSGSLNIRVEKLNWVSFRWHLPVLGAKTFEEEKVDGTDGLHFGLERTVGDVNQWCTISRWCVVQKLQSPSGTSELINMNTTSYTNVSPPIPQQNMFPSVVSPPMIHQSPQSLHQSPVMTFPQTPSTQPFVAPPTTQLPSFPSTPMNFPSTPSSHPSHTPSPTIPPSQPPPTQPVQPTPPAQTTAAPTSGLK